MVGKRPTYFANTFQCRRLNQKKKGHFYYRLGASDLLGRKLVQTGEQILPHHATVKGRLWQLSKAEQAQRRISWPACKQLPNNQIQENAPNMSVYSCRMVDCFESSPQEDPLGRHGVQENFVGCCGLDPFVCLTGYKLEIKWKETSF